MLAETLSWSKIDYDSEVENKKLEISKTEVAISMTKANSKIDKLGLYNKAINNPIYDGYWREVIKKEL